MVDIKGLNQLFFSYEAVKEEVREVEQKLGIFSKKELNEEFANSNYSKLGVNSKKRTGDEYGRVQSIVSKRGRISPIMFRSNNQPNVDQTTLNSSVHKVAPSQLVQANIPSTVQVAKHQSRSDKINEMTSDCGDKHSVEDLVRGKRMMKLMLGHLLAAQVDSERNRQSLSCQKRLELQEKINQQEQQRQEQFRLERQQLFDIKRKAKQRERFIAMKMREAEEFSRWKENLTLQKNFIRTQTTPHIFYKPANWTDTLETRLSESCAVIEDMIGKRRALLEVDICKANAGEGAAVTADPSCEPEDKPHLNEDHEDSARPVTFDPEDEEEEEVDMDRSPPSNFVHDDVGPSTEVKVELTSTCDNEESEVAGTVEPLVQ